MLDFLDNPVITEDMDNIFLSRGHWETLKNASFYVTGSTGMLATYFIYFLLYLNEEHDYGIHIYAEGRTLQKAKDRFGIYLSKNFFHWIQADVVGEVPIQERVDYIIHAAGLANTQCFAKMPVETMLPNVVGTYHLLEYARARDVKGFLFFSSGAVYGVTNGDVTEESRGLLDFLAPDSSYGESKRCGEALCRAYFLEYGVPTKSVRISHTYGPSVDVVNDRRVFCEFVKNIVDHTDIVLKTNGAARRPFCYISDGISALYTILLDGKVGEAYNLSNTEGYLSIRELAKLLVNLYPERGLNVIFQNKDDEAHLLPEGTNAPITDSSKLKLLGWIPKVSVQKGFERMVRFFEMRVG